MTLYNPTNRQTVALYNVGFGLSDERGRHVGNLVRISQADYVANENTGYHDGPGLWFEVRVQPTRDFIEYGATQRMHRFRTFEEAQSHADRQVEKSRKGYERKYGAR